MSDKEALPLRKRIDPEFAFAFLLCFLSLLLHLAYLGSSLPERNSLDTDGAIYMDLASHLAHQGQMSLSSPEFATAAAGERTLFWTPAYPLLLAAILKLGLPLSQVIRIFQAAMASCLPLLLLPTAKIFLKKKWLWGFLAFSAVYPYYFQMSYQISTEVMTLFLSLACLALVLAPKERSLPGFALLGSLMAWLCLTRPEYLVFTALLILWMVARSVFLRQHLRGVQILVLSAAFLIWVGPWVYRNYEITHAWVFTTRAGYSLVRQNEYEQALYTGTTKAGEMDEWFASLPTYGTEIERYRHLETRGVRFIHEHPGIYAQKCLKRFVSFFLPHEVKQWLGRAFGKENALGPKLPFWFRLSNLAFLIPLWLLTLPGLFLWIARKKIRPSFWLSPAGLLLLLMLGQFLVYVFLIYVEYQRSIMDMEIILLGFFLRSKPGRVSSGGNPDSESVHTTKLMA